MVKETKNKTFHFILNIEINNRKNEKVIFDKLHKYNARSERRDRIRITTNQIQITGDRIDEKSLYINKYNQDTALFSEIKRCLLFLHFLNYEIKDDGKLNLCYEKGTNVKEQKNWIVAELFDLSCFNNKRLFEINNLEILFTCKQSESLFCSLMHCILSSKENVGKLNERWKALNALYKTKNKQSSDAKGIDNILVYIDNNRNGLNNFNEFCNKNIDKFRDTVDIVYYLNKNEYIQIFSKYNIKKKDDFSQKRLNSINKIVDRFQDFELLNNIKSCITENEKYLFDSNDMICKKKYSSIIKTIDSVTKKDDFAFSEFFLKYIYQKRCELFHGSSIDYSFFKNDKKTENENKIFNQYLLELIAFLFNSDYLKDVINLDLLKEIEE